MLFFALRKVRGEFISISSLTALSLVHRRALEPLLWWAAVLALALLHSSITPSHAKVVVDRSSCDDRPGLDRDVPIQLDLI
jgi:hypothetical protein